MIQYHKIETVYNRDMDGNKKLIMGDFRSPIVEYLKDNEWIFTEKVDGTNIRVYWDGHKVVFGGRTDKAQLHGHLVDRLNQLFMGETNEEIFEQNFGESEVHLFGEGYGAGIQTGGDDYIDGKDFILFDVMINGVFLERKDIEVIAKAFGIDCVPIAPPKTIDEAIEYVKSEPKSMVGKRIKKMEGVVGTPKQRLLDIFGNRIIVKVKARDFIT